MTEAVNAEPLFGITVDRTDSDERFTPAWVFAALGETFDTDPASPIGGGDCVPAAVKYTRADDGLMQPWAGFVWCNPPFGNATAYADRFTAHSNGLWLGPVANARWMQDIARAADRVWLMRDFPFSHPTHAGKRSSMPLAMVGLGGRAVAALTRATLAQPAAGVLLRRVSDDVTAAL